MALSITSIIEVDKQILAGSEVAYAIPSGVISVVFRANGGTITMATTSGGDTFSLADKESIKIANRNLSGHTLYFDGTATLEILLEKTIDS